MKSNSVAHSTRIALLISGCVGLIAGVLAWIQVQREREIDIDDLDRRAHALAHQVSWTARQALTLNDEQDRRAIVERFTGFRRVIGFAVYDANAAYVLGGENLAEYNELLAPIVRRAINKGQEETAAETQHDAAVHILAYPLTDSEGKTVGALAVVHDMAFIEQRAANRLVQWGFWIVLISLLVVVLVLGTTWSTYERPMRRLAEWMQRVRTEEVSDAPPRGVPLALLASESDRLASSFRAARSGVLRDSQDATREQNAWTRERLRAHALDCLGGRQLVVVSNREPFMHQFRNGTAEVIVPAGGLVTALNPVLEACGGLWVAHGAGDADRASVDAFDRLSVPPGKGFYTLRRVWLTREEEQGYYYGLSNEGLWPLCHLAHERPTFRAEDWESYRKANHRFADAVLSEIGAAAATVLVQDYQLALVPALIKAARPDVQVGLFWHIPWPNPEAFRICPWRAELLKGMLGADVVGFHLQQYCNNFLDTVDRMVEARLDWDHFAVEISGHSALVRPFPISIEPWEERDQIAGEELEARIAQLRDQYKLGNQRVVVGVERVDYTKGLPERLRAFERFLTKYPEYRERVSFVLLAAPSRTHIRRYRELVSEIEALADEVNWKHQTDHWKPLRLMIAHHGPRDVHAFLRMADVCVVSPLHDGMNLVAKEYVGARPTGDGVLILSEFAGAARELSEAVMINPYDTEQFADAIQFAMAMPEAEKRLRMQAMQAQVRERNVYRWAAQLLRAVTSSQNWAGRGLQRARAASTEGAAIAGAVGVSL